MSLKEKAKTITEIAGEGGFNQPEVSTVRWVRLEDAQKEIDKREKDQNDAYEQLLKLFLKLEHERLELKQKLRQILDDFGDIQDYDNDDVIELHRALTKLLNEEKAK